MSPPDTGTARADTDREPMWNFRPVICLRLGNAGIREFGRDKNVQRTFREQRECGNVGMRECGNVGIRECGNPGMHEVYFSKCQSANRDLVMPKRAKRSTSPHAAQQAGKTICEAVGDKGATALRIAGSQNRYAIPSSSIPGHKHIVHLSPTGSRNSCSCPAHMLQRIRPCKHVLALKKLLEM